MFKLRNKISKIYKPVAFSCLVMILPQTVNAAGCDTGINILFKSFNEFVGLIPGISSAASGLKVLGYALQLNACNQEGSYAIEQNLKKMLDEFKRQLTEENRTARLDLLNAYSQTLDTNLETARNHTELDSNIRDVGYLEDDAVNVGFEALQVTINFSAIKLSMLLTQYFMAIEDNNKKEIEDIQKDIHIYMSASLDKMNRQESNLEKYLSEAIYSIPPVNVSVDVSPSIGSIGSIGYRGQNGTQINEITGESASLYDSFVNLEPTPTEGMQWVYNQRDKHRRKILTQDYKNAKAMIAQYATQPLSALIPDDLKAWDARNKTTSTISKGGVKGPIHIADFDGDGRNDLFSVWGTDKKWYLKSGGTGQWKSIQKAGVDFEDLAFGDFDEDGKTDVFYADGSKWKVSYGGTSSWKVINTSGVKTKDLFIGDFDGDDKADVFHADGKNWKISWTGKKSWKTINTSGAKTRDLLFGDFDNNGKLDVFLAFEGKWHVSYGGKTSWVQINTSGAKNKDLLIGDFDGDGYADVLGAGGSTWNISYSGNSGWKKTKSNMTVFRNQLFIGDFDSDGIDEILWKAP